MLLGKVLERAFAGCGLDFLEFQNSRRWQDCLDRFSSMSAQHPIGSELGALLHAGPHVVGELLTRHSANDVVKQAGKTTTAWQYDPLLLTAISCFGEALIDGAASCLPVHFEIDPNSDLLLDRLKLPMSQEDLIACWKAGDAKTRVQIAKLLAVTFAGRVNEDYTSEDDRANQPAERVLPACFGRWEQAKAEVAGTANCLGKAIMLAAFGKLVGAEMLAVLPVQLAHNIYYRKRGEVAAFCLDGLAATNVPLSKERRQSLLNIAGFGQAEEDEISWSHMGIALRIDTSAWVLIDPNMYRGLVSVFPDYWEVGHAHRLLTCWSEVLPGLSLLRQDKRIEERFEAYIDTCQQRCALLLLLTIQCFAQPRTKKELVDLLRKSAVLDALLTWPEFDASKLDPASSRKRKAICAFLEHHYDRTAQPLPDGGFPHQCQWYEFGDKDEQWLLDQLSDETAREALCNLCYKFITHGIKAMDEEWKQQRGDADLHHPRCQFASIGPGLSIAALGHVAHAMGASREVEPHLHCHCFDQFRLLYSAGKLILHPQTAGPEARQSAELLKRLPFILPSAEKVLKALEG
jgi:hypothetical protein